MPHLVARSLGAYDAVPLSILIVAEERIVFVNQLCRERFVSASRPLLGQSIWDLCAPLQRAEFRRAWATTNARERCAIWTVLVDGRGRFAPAALRVAPITYENLPSKIIVAQEPDLPPLPELDVALAPRERTVLRLLAEGSTTSDIAEILQISKQTVRIYIHTLTKKTRVRGRVELSLFARRAIQHAGAAPTDCATCPLQTARHQQEADRRAD
jgi:DNA-binding CsgD family transcriptional regulator